MRRHRVGVRFSAAVLAAVVLAAGTGEVRAQVAGVGGLALVFPVGTRNMGMGATGTAGIEGFQSGYFNPAGLAWADAFTLGASREKWHLELETEDIRASGGHRWDRGASGTWRVGGSLGYTTLGLESDQPQRTIFLPAGTGATFNIHDYYVSGTAGGAYERGVFTIATGATVKYLSETVAGETASAWAFDVGVIVAAPVLWQGSLIRPRIGYAATNLSTGMQIDSLEFELPGGRRWAFGIDLNTPKTGIGSGMWWRSVSVLGISIDHDRIGRTDDRPDHEPRTATGFEVNILETLQLRMGVGDGSYPPNEGNTYGLGLGWDFGRVVFQMDYARVHGDAVFGFEETDENVFGLIVGGRL